MPRLLLFAGLREIAGTSEIEIDAKTVGELVYKSCERFGNDFSTIVDHSKIWLDGEETELTVPIFSNSEIAILPPISGG